MQAPYFFVSPMLAPNQAWASFYLTTQTTAPEDFGILREMLPLSEPLTRLFPLVFAPDPTWLAEAEFIQKFGRNQAILALPDDIVSKPELEALCKRAQQSGAKLALLVRDSAVIKKVSAANFGHLLFDAKTARENVPLLDLINAHQFGFQLVATGVASHEIFDWAASKRFSLFSSEFITAADPRLGTDADTTRLKLMKLLSLVVQDADTREIEEIFRQEPKLSYNLLRLVNSVAVGPKTPITGFHQAITVLGRRQLQRWLQLLIYANQFGQGSQPNPLLQLAAARGRLLELLVSSLPAESVSQNAGEEAFMVGIFSLLDVVLRMPMSEILSTLPLSESITQALGTHTGVLGKLLSAQIASESRKIDDAAETLSALGISPSTHFSAEVDAFSWASKITIE